MRVHVTNPLMLTKELLPKLTKKKSGNIILISSIWGQTGAACEVAYSTAKGAQIAFVKALSKEVALSGIRVNAIAPGAVETAMMNQFTEEDKQTSSIRNSNGEARTSRRNSKWCEILAFG